MKEIRNVAYGTVSDAQVLDIFLPEGEVSSVFFYLHGGGLDHGDKNHADHFAPYLTDRGIAVVSANYRLYPNCAYPDYIHDAGDAVAYTYRYMREELGCEKLYVGGSSAGGYLSMMLCFDKQYLAAVGMDNSMISGYLHDAGQPTAHFAVLKHRGVDPRRVIIDESSPLYHVGTEEKYPPMRFIVSDNDMKCRYEQTMLMLVTLEHFEYKNFDHVVMHGRHCAYCGAHEEDGTSIFGKLIYDFIRKVEDNA